MKIIYAMRHGQADFQLTRKGELQVRATAEQIKQDFKEDIYTLNGELPNEEINSSLFKVIQQSPKQLLLKLQNESTTNDLLKHFIDKQIKITSFNEVLPSLNDIFIKLVEDTTATRKFQEI